MEGEFLPFLSFFTKKIRRSTSKMVVDFFQKIVYNKVTRLREKGVKKMTIYFDMDGTIANLYGVENWLEKLRAEDVSPYVEAEPLVDMCELSRLLNVLQLSGVNLGIISWLSKDATKEYDKMVRRAKREWLMENLPAVEWDEIHLVKYGTPKHSCCRENFGILFDDNDAVREKWEKRGMAFDVENILEILEIFSLI